MLLFILIFSKFISSLYSFNYQTVEHWRYLKQEKSTYKSSYFGYSLAIHRSSLLVGAPRDHSSHDIISRRGAIWKCEFQTDNNCQRIPFRRDGKKNSFFLFFLRISFCLFSKVKQMFVLVLHLIIKQING